MIRLGKEVQLYEWGEAPGTLNQVWTPIGEGATESQAEEKDGRHP